MKPEEYCKKFLEHSDNNPAAYDNYKSMIMGMLAPAIEKKVKSPDDYNVLTTIADEILDTKIPKEKRVRKFSKYLYTYTNEV